MSPLFPWLRHCLQDRITSLLQVMHTAKCPEVEASNKQARNFFSPPLEKCVGHSLKILDIVQKILAPLRKLFSHLLFQAGYGPGYKNCHTDTYFKTKPVVAHAAKC